MTGGAGGIGGAVSDALAAAGARVVIADLDADLADERVASIRTAGGDAESIVTDVRDVAVVRALAEGVLGDGPVDVLVNNVGHYLRPTPFLQTDEDHWARTPRDQRAARVPVHASVRPRDGRAGHRQRRQRHLGRGSPGIPARPRLRGDKAAVTHFTRCLALEVGGTGVRVNAIAPDVTQTAEVDYDVLVPDELRDRWPIWVPICARRQPADNADVVLFLASDLSRFLTGHVIPTDGGTVAAGGWFRTVKGRWTNRPRNP